VGDQRAGAAAEAGWQEGRDGASPTYEERLLPPWWIALAGLALVGMLAVAYGAAYGAAIGWVTFLPLAALVVVGLVRTAPVLRVDDRVFRAGSARLPLRWIGPVDVLDPDQARDARTVHADARALLVLRTWATARAVRVAVTDPEDPHPYWLVSTRHPDRLAAALAAARPGQAADG
jgi:hypothetical protein